VWLRLYFLFRCVFFYLILKIEYLSIFRVDGLLELFGLLVMLLVVHFVYLLDSNQLDR